MSLVRSLVASDHLLCRRPSRSDSDDKRGGKKRVKIHFIFIIVKTYTNSNNALIVKERKKVSYVV